MSERPDLLWRAARTPGAPAVESDAGTWCFAELADRAVRGAGFVTSTAPRTATPIGLLMSGNAQFAAWFHAIALAGRTVMPLNLRLTAGELAQQLASAGACWLLGEADDPRLGDLARYVPGLRVEVAPSLEALPAAAGSPRARRGGEDTTLAVLYTSGTAGRAKGACLSWGNFLASARGAEERLGRAVFERWLACMPLFHVGGLSVLMRSVLFGAPVRLHARFDAAAVSDALDGGDVAGISLVPTMLSRLLAHRAGRVAPPGLRVLLLGGAAVAPELVTRALATGYPVCPTYGLTEAASQVATAAPPPSRATRPAPMLPLAGTQVRIVADGQDQPPGAPGEIAVRGPTVMQGYLNEPDATARVLRDGWLYTGDVGYLDDAGGLHVLDRRDDLIISGGENVYPAEIEAALLAHPCVEDAAVTGIADPDLGARVVAWIVTAAGAAVDADALQRHCRARLAGYKQPREYRFVAALPRNAAGKLQRRRLAEPAAGR